LAGKESDLRFFALYAVKDVLKRRVTETTAFPRRHITLKSGTEPFWSIIESVPEWFVHTIQRVTTGHEDLKYCQMAQNYSPAFKSDSPSRKLWNRRGGA
jgi:hypothetical protein